MGENKHKNEYDDYDDDEEEEGTNDHEKEEEKGRTFSCSLQLNLQADHEKVSSLVRELSCNKVTFKAFLEVPCFSQIILILKILLPQRCFNPWVI